MHLKVLKMAIFPYKKGRLRLRINKMVPRGLGTFIFVIVLALELIGIGRRAPDHFSKQAPATSLKNLPVNSIYMYAYAYIQLMYSCRLT